MTSTPAARSPQSVGLVAGGTALVGLLVFAYGVLLVPLSVLGGAWVALGGLSLSLAGIFATRWAGERLGLSATTRRRMALACGTLAAALLVSFVLVDGATFESGTATGSARY